MIIRLEFNPSTDLLELYKFYKNPKGTCLSSSSAYNITPSKTEAVVLEAGQVSPTLMFN